MTAVSLDLFGTLVDADRPDDPATAVADELAVRGVAVPGDWAAAYGEAHVERATGAELALPVHVRAALADRGVEASPEAVERAVAAAFGAPVRPRRAAPALVDRLVGSGPVGVLSNCSVPGLVGRALDAAFDRSRFDAVVSSVDCGWRKPDPRAFRAVAAALGVAPTDLVHVGDDPSTDGGAERAGARSVVGDDPAALRTRVAEALA